MTLERDQAKVKNFFEGLIKLHGLNYKSLGYKSKESQLIRFDILSKVGDLNQASILDVGCGFGEFYDFLKARNPEVDYRGLDISPEMIALARKLHPDTYFEVADFLKWQNNMKIDYVISSGINNIRTNSNLEFAKKIIRKMFSFCNKGVAFNMLSDHTDISDPKAFYVKPEEIFCFCMKLTKSVVLRHDYKPNDFTLYLYRNSD